MPGLPPMRFRIIPDNDDPIVLNDLQVDPLPTIRGRVRVPRFDPDSNTITFAPIDRADLRASLLCPGGGPAQDAALRDQGGGGLDFYEFLPGVVDAALGSQLSATCTLTVAAGSATDFVPFQVDLLVRATLIRPTTWSCSTSPSSGPRTSAGLCTGSIVAPAPAPCSPCPAWRSRRRATWSSGSNRREPGTRNRHPWSIRTSRRRAMPRVCGSSGTRTPSKCSAAPTICSHLPPNFSPREIAITIDEDSRELEALVPPGGLELINGPGNNIGVELDAVGGRVRGVIEIRTIKGTIAFPDEAPHVPDFSMVLTRIAGSTPFATLPGGAPNVGVADVTTPDPGTYFATITPADHHELLEGEDPDDAIEVLQDPGEDVEFLRRYVELGQIDVKVVDSGNVALPTAQLDVTSALMTLRDRPVNSDGEASFLDLEVDATDPVGTPVEYTVAPRIPAAAGEDGYDLSASTVTIDTETEDPVVTCSPPADCSARALDIRAGGHQAVQFQIPQYGSIVGRAVGVVRAGGIETVLPLAPGGLTVVAQRVADPSCTPVPAEDATVTPVEDGFRFSGEPGFYTIAVDHPAYEDVPLSVPDPVEPCSTTLGQPVYQMTNDLPNVLPDPWVLQAERGTVDLIVLQNTLTGAGVPDAVVALRDLTDGTRPRPRRQHDRHRWAPRRARAGRRQLSPRDPQAGRPGRSVLPGHRDRQRARGRHAGGPDSCRPGAAPADRWHDRRPRRGDQQRERPGADPGRHRRVPRLRAAGDRGR